MARQWALPHVELTAESSTYQETHGGARGFGYIRELCSNLAYGLIAPKGDPHGFRSFVGTDGRCLLHVVTPVEHLKRG